MLNLIPSANDRPHRVRSLITPRNASWTCARLCSDNFHICDTIIAGPRSCHCVLCDVLNSFSFWIFSRTLVHNHLAKALSACHSHHNHYHCQQKVDPTHLTLSRHFLSVGRF